MFTKLRFQSRSKKFWNLWYINHYAIIIRSRLINIPIEFAIISQLFLSRLASTWQFGANVTNPNLWCISHLYPLWSLLIFVMLIMQYLLQFWQRN